MPKLTKELVETIVTDGLERTVFDSATPGFGLRLTAKGKAIWLARVGDQRFKLSLGTFPEKSLSAARTEAHAALRDIRDGKYPRAEKAARAGPPQ
jgi:hypothetical protein